ncbi:hypothetical protein MUY27_16040 [Mucilaginibacter sp. RS28]|uniref:Fasciclin domain-containing protein n=1 Tax=Mucilaginibacter straminoryzae TaxID=2932774 RepID=A0A9X2BA00_9SPHI|nr:hypothetical protein [Mucilaginibacter straminoryzae]MCJ8211229.1 hypothetical protein [Mucilaginibacter straminoryzae]
MKKVYLLALFLLALCVSSCVDIEERYSFKADGSCNVSYNFDMSQAVAVLMNLMSDSVAATPQFAMAKDTSLNFYSALPDTIQSKLSADEMKLAQSSDLNVKMNLRQNLMKVSIDHLATSPADLEYYLQHISKVANTTSLPTLAKGPKPPLKGFDASQLIAGQDYYIYEITPHKFYRIIDKTKFNNFVKKTQSTLVMAKALLIDMPYKLVLSFAKPVKTLDNKRAILSADRKTVTLVTNMDEVIKNPSVMNLKIDF